MIAKPRSAFTLIELMIAMVVAAVLASALLVALYGAQEEAREARSRAQIAKLNAIVAPQWESYVSRNVSILYQGNFTPRERALARLIGIRDLMRMELPDRITDLIRNHSTPNPSPAGPTQVTWAPGKQTMLGNSQTNTAIVPTLFRAYIRRINATYGAANLPYPQLTSNANNWSSRFQDAECLYLIVATLRDEDTTGLDFFRGTEIGDLDNDFMPELHDGWGNPIGFLRWAPGVESQIQQVENDPDPLAPTKRRPNRALQPDHLDLLKVDPAWGLMDPTFVMPATWRTRANEIPAPGYLLFPFIYSSGRDGTAWILTEKPNGRLDYTDQAAPVNMVLDPYQSIGTDTSGKPVFIGSTGTVDANGQVILADGFGEAYQGDNITNHLIEVK